MHCRVPPELYPHTREATVNDARACIRRSDRSPYPWIMRCNRCTTEHPCTSWDVALLAAGQPCDQHRFIAKLQRRYERGPVTAIQHWFTGEWVTTCAEWRHINRLARVPELQADAR